MSISRQRLTKINKRLLLILAACVIVVNFMCVYVSKEKSYTFKTGETNFTVKFTKEWVVKKVLRNPGSAGVESSPDEGIQLLLNGDPHNYIYIFSQYGTLAVPLESYNAEEFSTNQGVKGTLYKDKDNQANWQLILNQDISSGFFGATVNFKDKELLDQNEKRIRKILKSIEIKKP